MTSMQRPRAIGKRRIVKWIMFLFRLLGLWQTDKLSPIYLLYQIVLHFIFSFLYALSLCVRIVQIDNTTELIAASGMTLTVVALLFKFINLCYFRRIIAQILHDNETFVLANAGEREFVRRRMRFFTIVAIGYYSMANSAGASSFVAAALLRKLPFFGSYPLDWQMNEWNYWLVYGYQVAGMFILCNANVTIELLPGYLMFVTSVRLEILAQRLCTLGGRSTEAALMGCVKLHQNLLR